MERISISLFAFFLLAATAAANPLLLGLNKDAPGGAGPGIAEVGTAFTYEDGSAGTNTGTLVDALEVPAGAEVAIFSVATYVITATTQAYFSSGSVVFDSGGANEVTLTYILTGGDGADDGHITAIFAADVTGLAGGAAVDIDWDWLGEAIAMNGSDISIAIHFFSGLDETDLSATGCIKSQAGSGNEGETASVTTGSMAASAGDWLYVRGSMFGGGTGMNFSTGQSEDLTLNATGQDAIFSVGPVSANTTVTLEEDAQGNEYMSIVGLILTPE